jgi:hypothetical protein
VRPDNFDQRDAAIRRERDHASRVVGELPLLRAGLRVERDDVIMTRRDEYRSAPDDRRRLLLAVVVDLERPARLELRDVCAIDLLQIRVAIPLERLARGEPVVVVPERAHASADAAKESVLARTAAVLGEV